MEADTSIRGQPAPELGAPIPKNRMSDPKKARNLIIAQRRRLAPLWEVFDVIQEKLDCLPPDSAQDLRADGLGHLTNVNWGSMEMSVAAASEPIYNLMCGGRHFMRFHASPRASKDALVTAGLESLAASHKEMFMGWGARQPVFEQLAHFRTAFGLGITYHPRPLDWRFESLHPRNLVYPAMATTDINSWPWAGVVTSLNVPYLLERIAKNGAAAGWKYDGIRTAIRLFNADALQICDGAIRRPDLYFAGYGVNDLSFNQRDNQSMPALLFYVKEWDGSISEHVILDHEEAVFLYSQPGKYKQMSDVLNLLPHEIGPGVLSKLRGLAVKQLPMHDALDRLTNHEVDLAFMSGLIMQAAEGASLRKVHEVVFGACVIIPPGLSVQQTSFKDTGAAARSTGASMRGLITQQGAAFGGEVDVGEYEKSNQQFEQIYADKTALRTFQIDRLSGQMSIFCGSHWRRIMDAVASKEAESTRMIGDAMADGLTEPMLGEIRRVSHMTGGARGNRVNAMTGMQGSKEYWGLFTEAGKLDFARSHMAIMLDDDDGPGRWLKRDTPTYDSQQTQEAVNENGIMHSGNPVVIAGNDSHYLHLESHTAWIEALIAACQQGQEEPQKCLAAIGVAMTHCVPEMMPQPPGSAAPAPGHLSLLSQDKSMEQAVKAYATQWSKVLNFSRQLTQQLQAEAQKAQQQAAQSPHMDPVTAAKLEVEQQRLRLEAEKHNQNMRQDSETHQQKLTDMRELTAAKTNHEPATTPPALNPAVLGYNGAVAGIPGSPAFAIAAPGQAAVPGAIPAGQSAS